MRLRGRAATTLLRAAALGALLAGAAHAQGPAETPVAEPPAAPAAPVVTPVPAPVAEAPGTANLPAATPPASPAASPAVEAERMPPLQLKPSDLPPTAPAAALPAQAVPAAPPAAALPAEAVPAVPPQPAAAPQGVVPQTVAPTEPRAEPAEPAAAPPAARPGSRVDPREDTGPIVRPPVQTGDQWVYRRSRGDTSMVLRQSVQRVSAEGIALRTELPDTLDTSTALYTREWNLVASGYNDYLPALRYYAFPLYAGKRWSIDSALSNFGAGQTGRVKGEALAARWERIEVPAGKFLALRIEIDMESADPGDPERKVRVRETHWYVRTVLRPVKVESHSIVGEGVPTTEIIELMGYRMD